MKKAVQFLGILDILLGVFALLLSILQALVLSPLLLALLATVLGVSILAPGRIDVRSLLRSLLVVLGLLLGWLAIWCTPILTGIGLLKLRPWSRRAALILAAFWFLASVGLAFKDAFWGIAATALVTGPALGLTLGALLPRKSRELFDKGTDGR